MSPANITTTNFDPTEHTVTEVVEHIDNADPDEAARVIEAEQAGKARKGVIEHSGTVITDRLGRAIEGGVDYLGRSIG
jgi:nicotinate-nucleotide pyrophosphorylase